MRTTVSTLATLLLVSVLSLTAQQPLPPGAGPGRPRGPMPEPKTLKVLKGPASEIVSLMRNYSVSLGVMCNHCHMQGDFASDEKKEKEIARHMIGLVNDINSKFPDGKARVGCFTCHRGAKAPEMNPPVSAMQPPPRPPAQN